MAAILFLFLTLVSNAVNATSEIQHLYQYDIAGIEQPLLEQRLNFQDQKRVSYRGNVDQLLSNTVCILDESSECIGAGVVLDDASAHEVMPMMSLDYLSKHSFIVTNFHVIESGEIPQVLFMPSDSLNLDSGVLATAEIVSTAPGKDLALLLVRSKPQFVDGASMTSVSKDNIGDEVEAIGHPSGMMWTYTKGYISQVRAAYEWNYNDSYTMNADVIQTQTPISGGSSGGPLYNDKGKLIAINTMIKSGGQNLNFSISATEFRYLKTGYDNVEELKSLKKELDWDSFNSLVDKSFMEKERGRLDDGNNYQFYALKSDPSVGFIAVFRDMPKLSMIYLPYEDKGKSYKIFLNPEHSNAGAVFKVSVYLGEEIIMEGWDFDGDFEVDYII